jgi:hypothetical protein
MAAASAAAATPPAGSWGKAIEVPGLGALNAGGNADLASVSCGSAGNCAAGGSYLYRNGQQGFVVSQRNGRWGKAVEVPGLGALNTAGAAAVTSVSCGAAGSCAAGGNYQPSPVQSQGFVVSARNGRWGKAVEVPGLGRLNATRNAVVWSVSCAPAAYCAAGGDYQDGTDHVQGFVVSQRHGHWGKAIEVPGLGTLNTGVIAEVISVSCGSPGNCAAGGFYQNSSRQPLGFEVSQRHGHWGKAIEVPGLATLNAGRDAGVISVSCVPAGYCAAGGFYTDRHGHAQGFVTGARGR